MKKLIVVMMAFICVSSTTFAQRNANENATLRDEKRQVAAGIKNGTISRAEAKRIKKQAAQLQRTKKRNCGNGRAVAAQDRKLDRTIRRAKRN